MPKQPDFIKLYTEIRRHPLYPKGRVFTDFEAMQDILIEAYPSGIFSFNDTRELAIKWGWYHDDIHRFFKLLEAIKFLERSKNLGFFNEFKILKKAQWYSPEAEHNDTEGVAEQVVIEFNRVTKRRVSINPTIQKYVKARIREGRKMNPPVGIAQFVAVIEYMNRYWTIDKPDMADHIQPETLFSAKFFKYLEMAREGKRKKPTFIALKDD